MVSSLPQYGMISSFADELVVGSDMQRDCRSGQWPLKGFAHFGVIYFHLPVIAHFGVIYVHLAHDVLMYRRSGLEQVAKRGKLRGG